MTRSKFGRRMFLVALLAIAINGVSGATARAGSCIYTIAPELSTLGFSWVFGPHADNTGDDGLPYPHFSAGDAAYALTAISSAGGNGQPNPSNVAQLFGYLSPTVASGVSLQLGNDVVAPFQTYPFYPWRTGGTVEAPPGGVGVGGIANQLAQYGFEVREATGTAADQVSLGDAVGYANIYGLSAAFGTLSTGATDGGALMPYSGGNSYLAGDVTLIDTAGTLDIYTDTFTSTIDLAGAIGSVPGYVGFPQPIGGGIDNPVQTVTYELNTITIPLNNRITFIDDGILYDITTFGQIVAFTLCPEPSSIGLVTCGVLCVGGYFVGSGRRAGRAKTLRSASA